MQIEKDEIKRLRKAFYSIHSQIILASKKNGCKFNLLWFLYALDGEELKSQKQICEEWYMTKTTLNTLVKECEKLGYHIKQGNKIKNKSKFYSNSWNKRKTVFIFVEDEDKL